MGIRGRRLIFEYEVVTPMFLGGARDGGDELRIRETSVRGALAFWWRALTYAGIVSAAGGKQELALDRLRERELVLFGGPKGQGSFAFRTTGIEPPKVLKPGTVLLRNGLSTEKPAPVGKRMEDAGAVGEGVRYLAYGLVAAFSTKLDKDGKLEPGNIKTHAAQLERGAIAAGHRFNLEVTFRDDVPADLVVEITRAATVLGSLGGLGARVRRGFGSLSLMAVSEKNGDVANHVQPQNVEKYADIVRSLVWGAQPAAGLSTPDGRDFSVTAFGSGSICVVGTGSSSAIDALNEVGKGLLRYRAWGKFGKVGDTDVEGAFAADHKWFKSLTSTAPGHNKYVPERTAFGLPHNYGKIAGNEPVEVTGPVMPKGSANPRGMIIERRASPLSFRIQKIGNKFHPVALFMPTQFLPVPIVRAAGTELPYAFNPKVIEDYLEGISHKTRVLASAPYFPIAAKIFP